MGAISPRGCRHACYRLSPAAPGSAARARACCEAVGASHSSGSSFDFWAMYAANGTRIAAVGGTRLGTPLSQPIVTRQALSSGLGGRPSEYLAALGSTTKTGRPIV